MRVFRRPVTHIISPTLGGIGVADIFLNNSTTGSSAVTHIANVATGNMDQLNYVVPALEGGLVDASPWLIGAAIAAIAGKIFKV